MPKLASARIEDDAGTLDAGPAPRWSERRDLLRALLRGRAFERALGRTDDEPVLAAIAAASGLASDDRLVAPGRFIAAHLGHGVGLGAVARARGGAASELGRGLAPRSPLALAAGAAFVLRTEPSPSVAVALVERRWAAGEEFDAAVALAREQELPVLIVVIDATRPEVVLPSWSPSVHRGDFEAVRGRVRVGIEAARDGSGPELLTLSARAPAPVRRRFVDEDNEPDHGQHLDPLPAYERRLIISGFSRSDLDEMRREAAADVADSLGRRKPRPRRIPKWRRIATA